MKKLLTAMLSLALLGAANLPALASSSLPADEEPPMVIAPAPEEAPQSGFAIEIDGEGVDTRAFVMVPLRAVAEKLGFTVTWNNGVVTLTGTERYAEVTIGVNEYFAAPAKEGVMGASLFSLACAPVLTDGVTYVPVELFDALLGCEAGSVTLEGDTVKLRTGPSDEGTAQIPSPFTKYENLADAVRAAGFELDIPAAVNGSDHRVFQAIKGELLEAIYSKGGEETVRIRKAPGSGDLSGDCNEYSQIKVENGVTMKGEKGLVVVAIWEKNGYTYAITAGDGMNADAMAALVRTVK